MTNNEGVPPSGDSWCKTDLSSRKTSEGTFTWTISGLLGHRDEYAEREGLISKEFTLQSPDGKETKWILELVPKYGRDLVKVMVHSRNKFEVKAKIQVSIIECNRKKGLVNHSLFNEPHLCNFFRCSDVDIWRINWNTLKEAASRYMPNGDLTFNFELALYGTPETIFGSKTLNNVQGLKDRENEVQTGIKETPPNNCENLDEFYLSKELSDVLIECQDKKFEAHMVILSSSSPVFRGMFQADMKEKKNKYVEIKDLEPDVVAEMLKFIYTGSCIANEKNPDLDLLSDLLVASDKYQMRTLKNVCQSLLSSYLGVKNSLKFLVLGDMYGAEKLKELAMDVVINNMNGLVKTEEWKECKKKSPHIFIEVAEAMAKSAS